MIIGCIKDSFRPREEDEKLIGSKVSYLSVIQTLIYLANYTHHDISVKIQETKRHLNKPCVFNSTTESVLYRERFTPNYREYIYISKVIKLSTKKSRLAQNTKL